MEVLEENFGKKMFFFFNFGEILQKFEKFFFESNVLVFFFFFFFFLEFSKKSFKKFKIVFWQILKQLGKKFENVLIRFSGRQRKRCKFHDGIRTIFFLIINRIFKISSSKKRRGSAPGTCPVIFILLLSTMTGLLNVKNQKALIYLSRLRADQYWFLRRRFLGSLRGSHRNN